MQRRTDLQWYLFHSSLPKSQLFALNFKLDFLFSLRNFRFDGFQAEVTSFSHIKVQKKKNNNNKKLEEERMNEVKYENFKHGAYMALNFYYIGRSLW